MKRPPLCCDATAEVDDAVSTHRCDPQGSGTMARVRRFLTLSLGGGGSGGGGRGRHLTQQPLPAMDRSCIKSRDDLPAITTSPQILHSLRTEAELVLGKSLEDIMIEEDADQPYGVPSFVHSLCCYLLTHGVDYEILVSVDWCSEEVRSTYVVDSATENRGELTLSYETGEGASLASGLLRLFLQELPQPLLNREAASALLRIRKELCMSNNCELSDANKIRQSLNRKVPKPNLNLIQYLNGFLHQLRTANHNTCPVSSSALSRVLARALTEEGKRGGAVTEDCGAHHLSEMLLLNHVIIFRDVTQIVIEHRQSDAYSDSVSSAGETQDYEGDLLSTEDEDEDGLNEDSRGLLHPRSSDDIESESTTTSDTDDFRSPPVSPLNRPFLTPSEGTISRCLSSQRSPWNRDTFLPLDTASPVTLDPGAPVTLVEPPSPAEGGSHRGRTFLAEPKRFLKKESKGSRSPRKRKGHSDEALEGHDPKTFRSTAELPDVESFRTKITPFMKDCLPSVTGFLSSPDEPWKEEVRRSEYKSDYDVTQSAGEGESSCLSGGEISELEDSDGSRDADGSETEGVGLLPNPCPHEERRSSERFLPRGYKHSGGRKTKRKTRRRYSKDAGGRMQSSEEEERENIPVDGFTNLLSRAEDEPCKSEIIASESENSQPFRELLASNDPVQSDRSSWCLRGDAALSDNWQRTAHHYSREDDVKPLPSTNWYRTDDKNDDLPSFKFTESLDDFLNIPHGQNAVKLLSKHISSLKKRIKKFEEEFEKKAGYRPSHQDKMKHEEIKKQMSALSRLKKELKYMKEEVQEKRRSGSKVYPMSLLRCQESTTQQISPSSTTDNIVLAQDTLRQVEERLCSKRGDAKRPTELSLLSLEQYHDEKIDLQKALLYYEAKHGRPVTREDRDRVRPLYDRYRQVKRGIVRYSSRTKESIELAPILEGEAMDFTLASPQHRGSLQEEEETDDLDSGYSMTPMNHEPEPEEACPFIFPSIQEVNLGDLHALPIHELKERKREAREMKKRLRCALREFENKFEKETGRKMQKEDRGPMEHSYTEYKHVKAKLRLLEALLSKHSNSSRFDS